MGAASTLSATTGLTGTVPSVSGVDKEFGPLGAALLAQANGFRVESVQLMNDASKQQGSMVTPDKGATLLPTGTLFYLSIGNLQGVISQRPEHAQGVSRPAECQDVRSDYRLCLGCARPVER